MITLGTWPGTSLDAARAKVSAMSLQDVPDAMTFGALLAAWYEKKVEPHYRLTKCPATYVKRGSDALGHVQLTGLTTLRLVSALQQYATEAPVAANRCLGAWKLALDYGVECGYLPANPLARTTTGAVGGPEKQRARVLDDDEIKQLWAADLPMLRFLLLTGLRISEAQQGRLDGSHWQVDQTKNGKPHWVHLPPLALQQVKPFDRSPTGVQARLKRWCTREGVAPYTPHDLRRTCATRLAGLGVEPFVVERVLNHTMQGVMAIYNRHDYAAQRGEAAELWAAEVERLVQ